MEASAFAGAFVVVIGGAFSVFYRDYRNLQGAPYADGWLLGWLTKFHCVFFCAMFGSLRLYV